MANINFHNSSFVCVCVYAFLLLIYFYGLHSCILFSSKHSLTISIEFYVTFLGIEREIGALQLEVCSYTAITEI